MTSAVCDVASVAVAPAAVAQQQAAVYVVFSGELDKQLVAFTLANASAASGMQTTMFFTFWALAALRQGSATRGKSLIERMFGWMLPRGSQSLPLSQLQCGGFGPKLIRWRMRQRNVASLEQQIEVAQALGVRFIVCEASMDLMGFQRTEMLAGVDFGGAAECIGAAAKAQISMVI